MSDIIDSYDSVRIARIAKSKFLSMAKADDVSEEKLVEALDDMIRAIVRDELESEEWPGQDNNFGDVGP